MVIDRLTGNSSNLWLIFMAMNSMVELSDPIARFAAWFEKAKETEHSDATPFVLATTSVDGKPSARVVLLKAFDERGFVFYTNLESRKAKDLDVNNNAAVCFYWPSLGKQIRIEGTVERVSETEADAYFATRPRDAQLGAWASTQSAPLSSRSELEDRFSAFERKYTGQLVPRPPFWSGFRVVPERIEFWEFRENRLHDRTLYIRDGGKWVAQNLYP